MASKDAEERPGAQHWVPEGADLEQLREAAQGCRGCELYRDATQVVMGDGLPQARLVLLGEQPGDQEDKQGKPFVGPAGKLLDRALDEAGGEVPEVVVGGVAAAVPAPGELEQLAERVEQVWKDGERVVPFIAPT